MYVAILLTSPRAATLTDADIQPLADRWSDGALRWLSVGEAVEFSVPTLPQDLWDVWQDWQARGVDLAVLPADNRRKKMLLADMDSTMIQQECIDELAEMAGVGTRVKEITARAMNGELDFDGALTERVALLQGLPVSIIDQVYAERITMMPGGKTLIATMKAGGATAALVSGGFTAFTTRVAADLGFDSHRANRLIEADGLLTGEVAQPILGRAAKIEALEQITAELGISEADVIAVGDGANDLGMLGRAGMGVAAHAKPSVAAQTDVRINHGDLTALLYLQGYSKAEFVT